jgi:hypothetical protein
MRVKTVQRIVMTLLLIGSFAFLSTTAYQYGAFMLLPKLVLLTLLLIPKKTSKVVAFISFVFSIYSIYNAIGLLSHENIFTIHGVYGAAQLYIYEAFLFLILCGCSVIDLITGSGKELIKLRTLKKVMSIVYAAHAFYWIFVIASATIYSLANLRNTGGELSIGIIGGADIHLLPFFLPTIIFLVSLFVFSVLNIIFAFREKTSLPVQWIFLIFFIGKHHFIYPYTPSKLSRRRIRHVSPFSHDELDTAGFHYPTADALYCNCSYHHCDHTVSRGNQK